jgi:hypothetical protein
VHGVGDGLLVFRATPGQQGDVDNRHGLSFSAALELEHGSRLAGLDGVDRRGQAGLDVLGLRLRDVVALGTDMQRVGAPAQEGLR